MVQIFSCLLMFPLACSQLKTQTTASSLFPQRTEYVLPGRAPVRHSTSARSSKEMGLEQCAGPAVNICLSPWCCRDGRAGRGSALGRTHAACRLCAAGYPTACSCHGSAVRKDIEELCPPLPFEKGIVGASDA